MHQDAPSSRLVERSTPLPQAPPHPQARHERWRKHFVALLCLLPLLIDGPPTEVNSTPDIVSAPRNLAVTETDVPEGLMARAPLPEPDPDQVRILEALSQRKTALSAPELLRLAQTIAEECERHDFEPALILAVIFVESGGRPSAVSHVGALGLMQIMPPTGAEVARKMGLPWNGPSTLLDPVVNVKLGVAYLRTLTDCYEDMSAALAAYNWGPGRIDRRLRRGEELPTEYVNRVNAHYEIKEGKQTGRS